MTFKRSFILVVLLTTYFRGLAQETIIPALSDNYIYKLIDTAKKNYPRVRSFQNRINIAKSNLSKNKVSILNSLTLSYVYQPGTTTIDPVNPSTSYFKGLQAGVFVNIGSLFTQPYLTRAAKEELSIAHNEQDEYQLTLTTEVKKRYYLYVQRVGELKLQTKSAQDAESSLKDAKYKFQKGEETFDNYNKMQVQYTEHQQTKIEAETNVFIARADLEELLGTKLENIK